MTVPRRDRYLHVCAPRLGPRGCRAGTATPLRKRIARTGPRGIVTALFAAFNDAKRGNASGAVCAARKNGIDTPRSDWTVELGGTSIALALFRERVRCKQPADLAGDSRHILVAKPIDIVVIHGRLRAAGFRVFHADRLLQ